MNRMIGKIGSIVVSMTVLLFAISMLIPYNFGSYFVCLLLAIGYLMMVSGYCSECPPERSAAAKAGFASGIVYATLILLVYFSQLTCVLKGGLGDEAAGILDFQRSGLMFSYDLLGYGMMALSTFFIALTICPTCRAERVLKWLMLIHGIFFPVCLIMPMTNAFTTAGNSAIYGVIALECWCAWFLPVGILSMRHFQRT